jgi:hypothetical protein
MYSGKIAVPPGGGGIRKRVEASLFVLSPEIKDPDKVEIATGRTALCSCISQGTYYD